MYVHKFILNWQATHSGAVLKQIQWDLLIAHFWFHKLRVVPTLTT